MEPEKSQLKVTLQGSIPKVDDFTTYLRAVDAKMQGAPQSWRPETGTKSKDDEPLCFDCDFEADIELQNATSSLPTDQAPGGSRRISACSCFGGDYWSLTIRQAGANGLTDWKGLPPVPAETAFCDYAISDKYLNSFGEIYEILYNLIFSDKRVGTTGLVVVTGGTGSGKSNIIRGLIDLFLRQESNRSVWESRKRRPHLVTFEDPIEKRLLTSPEMEDRWVDYTPRQLRIDVHDLKSAIKSALRQTPAALYVGEIRDIREWRALLEFAGTGHLVFATSHAGSLVEAMGKLFAATRSHTAAKRAVVADRLAALVHLRTSKIDFGDNGSRINRNVTIPSLWRRTMVGSKTLTAEGQSSLLPHSYNGSPTEFQFGPPHSPNAIAFGHPLACGDQSSFGRVFFKELLWSAAETRIRKGINGAAVGLEDVSKLISNFRAKLDRSATEWDLEGL